MPLIKKVALPLLKRAGKHVGRKVLQGAIDTGGDILQGRKVKGTITRRSKETLRNIFNQKGSGLSSHRNKKRLGESKKSIKRKIDYTDILSPVKKKK